MATNTKNWKYGMKNRPFGIGCQPSGFILYKEADKRATGYYGFLYYVEQLTPAQVQQYELVDLNNGAMDYYTFPYVDEVILNAETTGEALELLNEYFPENTWVTANNSTIGKPTGYPVTVQVTGAFEQEKEGLLVAQAQERAGGEYYLIVNPETFEIYLEVAE